MSPEAGDDLPYQAPDVGRLGESPLEYERRRLREQMDKRTGPLTPDERVARDRLNRELREREESVQDRHEAIAAMAAGRAPALVRAYNRGELSGGVRHANPTETTQPQGPYPFDEREQRVVPVEMPLQPPAPLDHQEVQQLIAFEMREAFKGLQSFLGGIRQDIQEQSRLMSFMDAPMEAITGAHERAAQSFETLREDIAAHLMGSGLSDLARVIDTAGLGEAQSRAEQRFEILAARIEARLQSIEEVHAKTFRSIAEDMLKVVHLLERLQARELREMKRRADA